MSSVVRSYLENERTKAGSEAAANEKEFSDLERRRSERQAELVEFESASSA